MMFEIYLLAGLVYYSFSHDSINISSDDGMKVLHLCIFSRKPCKDHLSKRTTKMHVSKATTRPPAVNENLQTENLQTENLQTMEVALPTQHQTEANASEGALIKSYALESESDLGFNLEKGSDDEIKVMHLCIFTPNPCKSSKRTTKMLASEAITRPPAVNQILQTTEVTLQTQHQSKANASQEKCFCELEYKSYLELNQEKESKHEHFPFTYDHGPNGLDKWASFCPDCTGSHQSPIDIDNAKLKTIKLSKLSWSKLYFEYPEAMTITNNGHTIVLHAFFGEDWRPTLKGGPLKIGYILDHIHFHWGSTDEEGSEHKVDSQSFCMEMHAVHYRSDLKLDEAKKHPEGLVVVGYIFEIMENENTAIAHIAHLFPQMKCKHNEPIIVTDVFDLSELMYPFDKNYVTYKGSLTTPPCSESVVWIIAPNTVGISTKQIEMFRCVLKAENIERNFRPTQPINDRFLYFVTTGCFK